MEKSSQHQFIEISVLPEELNNRHVIKQKVEKKVNRKVGDGEYRIIRRSLDARKKPIVYRLRIAIGDEGDEAPGFKLTKIKGGEQSAVIVGFGPAGMFAALELLKLGVKPIVLERGKPVRERRRDLVKIVRERNVEPDSNYCFGEGGAGTFSDGKLYTRSKKRGDIRSVLHAFVEHGADADILVNAHPHIGTNKLPEIVQSIREAIIKAGGEVRFETRVESISHEGNQVLGVITNKGVINANHIILATGHSARDVFQFLKEQSIRIEAKPFALGVRIEHQQSFIDQLQYSCNDRGPYLPPASYSLVKQINGRGVFSFCMCPGGIIAPAMTASNEVVVNGWSPSKRNGEFANSGFVVQVDPSDWQEFSDHQELAPMAFQAKIEHKAFLAGGSNLSAPAQRASDLLANRVSTSLPDCSYIPGLLSADLRSVLPPKFVDCITGALKVFNKRMPGYAGKNAVLVGVESRTSSPVRIPRDRESLEHTEIKGLYPCGEGAGYAGGIMSAALDGIACARRIGINLGKLPSPESQKAQR